MVINWRAIFTIAGRDSGGKKTVKAFAASMISGDPMISLVAASADMASTLSEFWVR